MERINRLEDDTELVRWINSEMRKAKSHASEWREMARECYDFGASKQWSEEDTAILTEQKRPPVTFNRISRTVRAICGLEVQNRQEVSFIPRELGDSGTNELLTSAAKYIRDNCDAEDEESESFEDLIYTGMGWTETRLDYELQQDGKVIIERVDPLEMFWDCGSRKRNLDDAKWIARVKAMGQDDVEAQWPDFSASPGQDWLSDDTDVHEKSDYANADEVGAKDKQYQVVEFQWFERTPYYRIQSPDGQLVEFPEERFKTMQDTLDQQGIKYVKQIKREYYKAFLIGETLLEMMRAPVDGFTLRCMTGIRDRNAGTYFGLVALMLDPQRWANKWLSQIMFILNSNAKGGIMAEAGAFQNPKKAEEEWAKPNSITWLTNGAVAGGKIQPKPAAPYPQGIQALMQYALESINDVPGVNTELLGLADRQQAGVLEYQRKQAGVTMLATFFDALRRYRKEQGRILVQYIIRYLSDGRLIRIDGDKQQFIPLLRQSGVVEYDVIVDEAPTSPSMKERVFSIMRDLIPIFGSMQKPVPMEILDYSPLPSSLVQKWKQESQPNPQMQMQQQQMQQMTMADAQQKIRKTASEAAENEAQTDKIRSEIAATQLQTVQTLMPHIAQGVPIQPTPRPMPPPIPRPPMPPQMQMPMQPIPTEIAMPSRMPQSIPPTM